MGFTWCHFGEWKHNFHCCHHFVCCSQRKICVDNEPANHRFSHVPFQCSLSLNPSLGKCLQQAGTYQRPCQIPCGTCSQHFFHCQITHHVCKVSIFVCYALGKWPPFSWCHQIQVPFMRWWRNFCQETFLLLPANPQASPELPNLQLKSSSGQPNFKPPPHPPPLSLSKWAVFSATCTCKCNVLSGCKTWQAHTIWRHLFLWTWPMVKPTIACVRPINTLLCKQTLLAAWEEA